MVRTIQEDARPLSSYDFLKGKGDFLIPEFIIRIQEIQNFGI